MSNPRRFPTEEPGQLLRLAQQAHTAGRIDEALATVRRAVELDPSFADAWVYLGTTLVTRKLDFAAGLVALERALALAPDDPGVQYSLGWCYEFVAYRLSRQDGRHFRDPNELLRLAALHLKRTIELDPEPGLKDDAADLLQSIEDRLS
jgi:tetratricopeptide (TPR) repeat protein